jgi:hypothetical protein
MSHVGGGIVRYSYCTPRFILGTPMSRALGQDQWAGISSQSRWQGVIFAREGDPRIVPIVRPADNLVAFNTFWSVQSKGTLISQNLKQHKGGAEMIVFISERGLSAPLEKGDTVFIDAEMSYAAIRIPTGGWKWREGGLDYRAETGEERRGPRGKVMQLNEEYAPVILEVMDKEQAGSFEAFQKLVLATQPVIQNRVLRYRSIYGEMLTLDTSYKDDPTVNGVPVNYEPEMVYDSPFLSSPYDSGVITLRKGRRSRVLDFNKLVVTDFMK